MAPAAPQPRYMQLAQALMTEIEAGRYPVGALIPTEHQLCEQFGASRFTVREAVKRLVDLGLLSRRAGVGTQVLSTRPRTVYRQVMDGIAGLQHYTAETELEITDMEMAPLDAETAIMLGAPVAQAWLHVQGLRRLAAGPGTPICATDIFIHPAFRSVGQLGGRSTVPVYVRLEQQFGQVVTEVEQQLRAVPLGRAHARRLQAKPGTPAMWVCRLYRNRQAEVIEAAISIHPAERFSYSETFRRERGGALIPGGRGDAG